MWGFLFWGIIILLMIFAVFKPEGRRRYKLHMASKAVLDVHRAWGDSWRDGWSSMCFHLDSLVDENGEFRVIPKEEFPHGKMVKVSRHFLLWWEED